LWLMTEGRSAAASLPEGADPAGTCAEPGAAVIGPNNTAAAIAGNT